MLLLWGLEVTKGCHGNMAVGAAVISSTKAWLDPIFEFTSAKAARIFEDGFLTSSKTQNHPKPAKSRVLPLVFSLRIGAQQLPFMRLHLHSPRSHVHGAHSWANVVPMRVVPGKDEIPGWGRWKMWVNQEKDDRIAMNWSIGCLMMSLNSIFQYPFLNPISWALASFPLDSLPLLGNICNKRSLILHDPITSTHSQQNHYWGDFAVTHLSFGGFCCWVRF